MPEKSLTATIVEHSLQTCGYHAQRLPTEFAQALNGVILVKTNRHTPAKAHVILFSRALELPDATRRDDYRLRFQIACNCRDANQSGGLEDCMHITPPGVTHAANLSWFMVHVAYRLQTDRRQHAPDDSILALQADGRGSTSVEETIKRLGAKPAPVL
jgi:hypothetical protein